MFDRSGPAEARGDVIRALFLLAALTFASPALGQNFSCRIGTTPACLDYGDTICSSSGICVDRNSACFERYQCNFEGFTCRSNVTECVDTYERLLAEHNGLVRDYNALLEEQRALVEEHNRNIEVTLRLRRDLDDLESCLILANTLAEAQLCTQ